MEATFFANNRQKFVQSLADHSVAVFFAGTAPQKTNDTHYDFTPNRNFYYLTGLEVQQPILVITKKGTTIEQTLYIEKADPVLEKWIGKRATVDEVRGISGVHTIKFLDAFEAEFNKTLAKHDFQNLYLDLERTGFDALQTRAQAFAKDVREKYPHLQIRNAYHTISELRTIKSAEEVNNMRRAIEITRDGITRMMENARPGIVEHEMEAHFDFTLKSNGVRHHAFPSIIAGGHNATVLHYDANNQPVEDGSLLQIDLGATYGHYSADISRVFPINGKFTDRQKEIYNVVLHTELEVIKSIKPGLPFVKLQELAKQLLAEGCKKLGLIENDEELQRYYFHGVSHYLGLDTHDVGSYDILQPGMVITVEPGLYIEEESIGIRIEDDVLVTEDGYEVLSQDIIKTVEEIEAFMAGKNK